MANADPDVPDDGPSPTSAAAPEGSTAQDEAGATRRSRRERESKQKDRGLLRGSNTSTQLLVVALCALLGIAVVTQVRTTQDDPYASLRQEDLVRLLDELDRRQTDLTEENAALRNELDTLQNESADASNAAEAASQLAATQGVIAGTVPVQGPGVSITINDSNGEVRVQNMINVLQELRNAGAEAIAVNDVRLNGTSYFESGPNGELSVDGNEIAPPYQWVAIGDGRTMALALDIPGGALSSIRSRGAQVNVTESDQLTITAVTELSPPTLAEPSE